jgi:hypothetical protein
MVHITSFDNPCTPLWQSVIDPIFGYSRFTAAILVLTLAFLIAFSLNRIVLKFGLLHQQSMLPFFIYTLFASAFLSVQKLNPVWIFTLFFVLGIEQIFSGVGKRKPQVNCFNASLLIGIGALFYTKGLFLFAIFILIMAILRIANYKSIIAALLGLIFPFASILVYFYCTDNIINFFIDFKENILSTSGQYNHNFFSKFYLGIIILINAISLILSFNSMKAQKILTRRYFRCFTWMIFILCAAILTPFFSLEIIPVTAMISTVIITLWLDKMKRLRLREAITILLVTITILGQIFLY